MDDVLMDD